MQPLAIELADRAVAVARAGAVLGIAPSAVFDGSGADPVGANGWSALRSRPMAVSTRHLSSVLSQRETSKRAEALVTRELAGRFVQHPVEMSERLWIAVPARMDVKGLGTLLGITRALALPVDGFVDSAAVTVAALDPGRDAIVLELGLHHSGATAVDSDFAQARRRSSVIADRAGLVDLYQGWLELIAMTLVRQTRFDPLHDAATEQQLFDALPAIAAEAGALGSAKASVTKGGERFEVELTRDQFVQASRPVYAAMLGLVQQLRPAGASVAIVLSRTVAELPGFRAALEQFSGCELLVVPEGFAAAAASLLDFPKTLEDHSVRLLRRVPHHAGNTLEVLSRDTLGKRRFGGPAPSHVLLEGRAHSLSGDALSVGRASNTSRFINLPDGLAGVSRRHCTFVRDGEDLILLDHSTFGTFVNGVRVVERIRVYAGDTVRVGEPGVELALIAVGAPAGSI